MASKNSRHLPAPPEGQVLIYQDGTLNLQVRLDGQTVWLTQAGIAELFQTTPQNITLHIKSIYDEGEQDEAATCKEYLQVRAEGVRQVQRALKHYNLDMILAAGYRVQLFYSTQIPACLWFLARRKSPSPLRGEGRGEGVAAYRDVPGFCRAAMLDDIRKHGHVLPPGRYVGAEAQEDDGEPFEE